MFHAVSKDPRPAIFEYDRLGLGRKAPTDTGDKSTVPTIWWIRSMTSGAFQEWIVRNNDEMSMKDIPAATRARALDGRDKDMITQQLDRIENCWEPGDEVKDPVAIRQVLDVLDFSQQQDLLTWCRNTAALEAAAK